MMGPSQLLALRDIHAYMFPNHGPKGQKDPTMSPQSQMDRSGCHPSGLCKQQVETAGAAQCGQTCNPNVHMVGNTLTGGITGRVSSDPSVMVEVAVSATSGFGTALMALREGRRVTRAGWNGRGMFLELQRPDMNTKMQRPYIYMSPVGGDFVPWVASHSDLLAEDWAILPHGHVNLPF